MRRTAEHLSDLVLEEIGRVLRHDDGEYVYVLDVEQGEVLMFERSDWPESSMYDEDESQVPAWRLERRKRGRARAAFRRVEDLLAREGKLDLWQAFETRADIDDARDWLRSAGLLPGDDEDDAPGE